MLKAMNIVINTPVFFSEKGIREKNEDSVYPDSGVFTGREDLFLVCDGVGGADRGEVASRLACASFSRYFSENEISASENDLRKAFDFVQTEFDNYLLKEPFAKGMGTTLVLLYIHKKGATVAHCGDSRLYHFRKGHIIWKTLDHTPVNDLVRQGIITQEEALKHPKSNRITRAIQGFSIHNSLPDIQIINDLEPGDLFFLCSDGVYECFSDENLLEVMSSEYSLNKKMQIIKKTCESDSGDNFSGYLIEIKSIEPDSVKKNRFSNFHIFTKKAG